MASELIDHDHLAAAAVRCSALAALRFEAVSDSGDDPLCRHAVHVGERKQPFEGDLPLTAFV